MGAVQKLATVVIVGMVALSTLLVIYLADEPNRMSAEAVEQEDVAIERGINTYLQNCVVCHGPAGEGYSEPGAEGTGRIGMPLGGDTELGRKAQELNQSDGPGRPPGAVRPDYEDDTERAWAHAGVGTRSGRWRAPQR